MRIERKVTSVVCRRRSKVERKAWQESEVDDMDDLMAETDGKGCIVRAGACDMLKDERHKSHLRMK